MSLHDKIIDIPPSRTDSQGYLIGHRDARHAAAKLAAEADAQIAALQAECEALRADMDWLEKRKQREARDGGYSAFFVIHLPAMASGPWQRDHGGEFDCKTLREAIDNERSKA